MTMTTPPTGRDGERRASEGPQNATRRAIHDTAHDTPPAASTHVDPEEPTITPTSLREAAVEIISCGISAFCW